MTQIQRLLHFLLFIALAAFVGGCGNEGPETYPVTGKVLIGGQPMKDILVRFEPVDPALQMASGRTNEQGVYTLLTGNKGFEGAMAGKYKVVLAPSATGGPPDAGGAPGAGGGPAPQMYQPGGAAGGGSGVPGVPPNPFPDEWASASTSPKEVEVTAGDNVIDIEVPARS